MWTFSSAVRNLSLIHFTVAYIPVPLQTPTDWLTDRCISDRQMYGISEQWQTDVSVTNTLTIVLCWLEEMTIVLCWLEEMTIVLCWLEEKFGFATIIIKKYHICQLQFSLPNILHYVIKYPLAMVATGRKLKWTAQTVNQLCYYSAGRGWCYTAMITSQLQAQWIYRLCKWLILA